MDRVQPPKDRENMNRRIPYGRQDINTADLDAVIETLTSDYLTQGPAVPRFEAAVTAYSGARHALAVNSATSALHIACAALGLGPGDLLWTSPITFVASANCGHYCGADVDFVDIDPTTFNMCPERLEAKLKQARLDGRLPKIVIPVHMAGQSCDMQAIGALAREYGFRVIEDASHAVGGKYLGQPVGNCRFSDITIFSFHPVKIITTAEGGMAMTNDDELATKMSLLRSHGITRAAGMMAQEPHGSWYYEQRILGFNYRLTDLQAALGTSQMDRLDAFVAKRHNIAARYDDLLSALPVVTPVRRNDTYSAFHLYIVRIPQNSSTIDRRTVFDSMAAANIGVNVHYIPVHMQPYWREHGHANTVLPEAERYYGEALTLPLFPNLTHEEQDFVIDTLARTLRI
jgi:UDP-4-amino-4,6-dideoxy-N-acetyl-beta-L-altrosamine transaminase